MAPTTTTGSDSSKQAGDNPIRPWVSITITNGEADEGTSIYKVPFRYFKEATVTSQLFGAPPKLNLKLEDTAFTDLYQVFQRAYKSLADFKASGDIECEGLDTTVDRMPRVKFQWGIVGITKTGAPRMVSSPVLSFTILRVSEDVQPDKIVFDIEGIGLAGAKMLEQSNEQIQYTSPQDWLEKISKLWKIEIVVADGSAPLAKVPAMDAKDQPSGSVSNRQRYMWFVAEVLPLLRSENGRGYFLKYGTEAGDENKLFLVEKPDQTQPPTEDKDSLGFFCSNMLSDPGPGDICLEWKDFRSRILNLSFSCSRAEALLMSGFSFTTIGLDGELIEKKSGTATPSGQTVTEISNVNKARALGFESELEMRTHEIQELDDAIAGSIGMHVEVMGNPQLLLDFENKKAAVRIPLKSFEANKVGLSNRVHWASGPYSVKGLQHRISSESYTTSLDLMADFTKGTPV